MVKVLLNILCENMDSNAEEIMINLESLIKTFEYIDVNFYEYILFFQVLVFQIHPVKVQDGEDNQCNWI